MKARGRVDREASGRPAPEKTGLGCDGRRLVRVAFGPEDFRALWGGGLEDYLDFLAARQGVWEQLRGENGGCWVVTVPFDAAEYAAWLAADPRRGAAADPLARWAAWVARRPGLLAALRARHPLHHGVPPDEVLRVEAVVGFLPVRVPDAVTLRRLRRRLPVPLLRGLVRGICPTLLRACPPFERLSRHRARGVTLLPADGFLDPAGLAEGVPDLLGAAAGGLPAGPLPASWRLPARFRLRPRRDRPYPRPLLCCLPLLLAGGASDVEAACVRLEGVNWEGAPPSFLAPWIEHLAAQGARVQSDPGGGFTRDLDFLQFLIDQLEDLPARAPTPPLPGARPRLRRIK